MRKFYCTFGQSSPFKNGYVEVYADSMKDAIVLCNSFIKQYSKIHGEQIFRPELYPQGKLGEIGK